MDNATIIEQCASGNRAAMESLYCRFSLRMMRVIRRYLGDMKSAQDILHDGFILIFTHIGDVRNPEKLEFWMGTVMKNLCLRYLENLDITTILDEEIDVPDIPELDDILSYEEISLLINRLPDGYRTVFKLAVLEGKSHKEIGKILGISPNSSSSQLYHAKVLLRHLIAEHKRKTGILSILLLLCVAVIMNMGKLRRNEDSRFFLSESVVPVFSSDINSSFGMAENLYPRTELASVSKIHSLSVETVSDTIAEVAPDIIIYDTEIACADSLKEEPMIIPSIPTVERQFEDMPRKLTAHSGMTIGAHYSVGSSTPDIFSRNSPDMVSDASGSNSPQNPTIIIPELLSEINHSLPITAGISVQKKITSRFGIETGLNYTYMRSRIRYYTVNKTQTVKASFIGIPLKADYIFYKHSRLSLYGTVGACVDFPAGTSVRTHHEPSRFPDIALPPVKYKPEISLQAGLGLHYSITPAVGLYMEPSFRYYFENHAPTPTYWQEHRKLLTLPIGIRINW